MIKVREVSARDNLQQIVDQINQSTWDKSNDIVDYEVQPLSAYLSRQDTMLILCHDHSETQSTFLGMASCRVQIRPYQNTRWLYVDEVDVCADQRQRGAGKAMMEYLISYARQNHCEELWLGTEIDNISANALYRSLKPDDIEEFVGYTFEFSD